MTLIDSVLTMLGMTTEKEYERQIATINVVIVVCDTEEGAPLQSYVPQKRPTDAINTPPAAPLPKRQKSTPSDKNDNTFS